MLALYAAFFVRKRLRIEFIERCLSLQSAPPPPSEDDERNEQQICAALFSEECRHEIEDLFRSAVIQMRGATYAQSDDALKCLSFLQEITATAMWKYRCSVGEVLEAFVREYDRLDVEAERKRLYAQAQDM